MSTENEPPPGFIYWPVSTGDSSTIKVTDNTFLQIDIRHMEKSDDEDEDAYPVVDCLVELLPTIDKKPYLSTFVLTHPDQDHCQGFAKLQEQVTIGELWLSPRTFREYTKDLCNDAQAFKKEAERRVTETIKAGGDPGSGNRVRIIGYDYLLKEDFYIGFPKEFFSVPGHSITMLDGHDYSEEFRAFVHAPFLSDSYGDRNDCSLAFQITLANDGEVAKALFFGDLTYPILKRIFEVSEAENLEWNLLLAPHHCSKSVMYWKDEGEDEESLKKDILKMIQEAALDTGYIIASSVAIPTSNNAGDNPPHAKAKREYLQIVPNEFICTHEHPSKTEIKPVTFTVSDQGFGYVVPDNHEAVGLEESIKAAQGSNDTHVDAVGYGCKTK